ncbi:MAG: MFS transporter [Anaerolineales bacterium]|nr:MFS transporter [Anaerolineales bacterium]
MMNNKSTQVKSMKPFFVVWTGQAFSLFGSSLVQFALVWYLTQRTGSATILATATLVAFLPDVFLGPYIGALVDRWSRRLVMMAADGLIALATLGLAALFLADKVEVWHIYVIMFIRALGGTFHWPAMQSSTSLMVPTEHLSRIAGLNQALRGAMSIVAPMAGALLLAVIPMQGILAIDVGTAVIAIICLFFVIIPQPEQSPEDQGSALKAMLEGFRYVKAWPGMMLLMLMATVLNFFINPAFSLTPLLVTEHFKGGALQLGWMESAMGIGVVAGGLVLSVWGGFKKRILTTLMGLAVCGLGVLAIGFTPAEYLNIAIASMFIGGFAMPIVNGPLFAILQDKVAPEKQGRVFTLVSSLAGAAAPLGLAIAGPVADWIGVQGWFVVAGVVSLLMAVTGPLMRPIMKLEENHREIKAEAPLENNSELKEAATERHKGVSPEEQIVCRPQ